MSTAEACALALRRLEGGAASAEAAASALEASVRLMVVRELRYSVRAPPRTASRKLRAMSRTVAPPRASAARDEPPERAEAAGGLQERAESAGGQQVEAEGAGGPQGQDEVVGGPQGQDE
eukprot:901486-Prymnesium_polylepis.2